MPVIKFKTVDAFLQSLDTAKSSQVQILRELILSLQPDLIERIKWNAPSYVLDGEDRITFNVMNKSNLVTIIIHMGATRKEDKTSLPILADDGGIVVWSSDIRGIIAFENVQDVYDKSDSLRQVLSAWLAIPSN